jgi:undecaprenyl diphosphate synthase
MPLAHNQFPITDNHSLPRHVAIIMDGNGRWAAARKLPRAAGHKKGADALKKTLEACREQGIEYLTVYAFSSENWKRPKGEVNDLMQLLKHYLERELDSLIENGVRLRFIGDFNRLPEDICGQIAGAMDATSQPGKFTLTIALSYGGRWEITRAVQGLARLLEAGEVKREEIDEQCMGNMLSTSGLPDPDLLIRTGGEQRLSNFLLWQSAYAELYFTPTLWPDFDAGHLNEALQEYARRERRYGTTGQ